MRIVIALLLLLVGRVFGVETELETLEMKPSLDMARALREDSVKPKPRSFYAPGRTQLAKTSFSRRSGMSSLLNISLGWLASFASPKSHEARLLLRVKRFGRNPYRGHPQDLRKRFAADTLRFLGGAHFASRFEEWMPEKVIAWCAYSAGWWICPPRNAAAPAGIAARMTHAIGLP